MKPKEILSNKVTLTMSELAQEFDYYMCDTESYFCSVDTKHKHGKGYAKGFTIGRGKKIHWYISPSPSGFYYAYPNENGLLGWRRQVDPNKEVTVWYK